MEILYLIAMLVSIISTTLIAFDASRRRGPVERAFAWLMVDLAYISIMFLLMALISDRELVYLIARLRFLGLSYIAVLVLLFVAHYTNQTAWLDQNRWLLLFIIPTFTQFLIWTNDAHGLFYDSWDIERHGFLNIEQPDYAGWYPLYATYAYIILAVTIGLLVRKILHTSRVLRPQVYGILVSILVPIAFNMPGTLGFLPSGVPNLTPIGFALAGLGFTWTLYQFKLFDLVPIAADMIVKNLDALVFVFDSELRLVDINTAATERLALSSRDEALGKTSEELFSDYSHLFKKYRGFNALDTELVVAENEIYDMRLTPIMHRDVRVGLLLVLHNITHIKRTEQDLLVRDRALAESTSGVMISDARRPNSPAVYVNDAFVQLTGYDADAITGRPVTFLFQHDETQDGLNALHRALVEGDHCTTILSAQHASGSRFWIEVRLSPVHDHDGRLTHFISYHNDVTERVRQEQTREQMIHDLDSYAHMVAHDLRGPIATIMQGVELIRELYEDEIPDEPLFDTIRRTGNIMTDTVKSMLLLASMREEYSVDVEPVEMCPVVENAMLRLQSDIEKSGAQIQKVGDLPTALGFGPWLEEVWANYISNAIKYGGTPPVIEIGAAEMGSQVRYWVQDNGIGVAAEDRAIIFDEFKRVRPKTVAGQGLGLAIVKRIIHRLGGEVGLESAPGGGSIFSFTLQKGD